MKRGLWFLLGLVVAVGAGIGFSLQPWQDYRARNADRSEATRAMREAEQERADLIRKQARAMSPLGKEELARDRGYRAPNEVPLDLGP